MGVLGIRSTSDENERQGLSLARMRDGSLRCVSAAFRAWTDNEYAARPYPEHPPATTVAGGVRAVHEGRIRLRGGSHVSAKS